MIPELKDNTRRLNAGMEKGSDLLQEVNPDPVFVRDPDGNFLYANRAFCDLFNLEGDEVEGRNANDVLPAEFLKGLWEIERAARLSGQLEEGQLHTPLDDESRSFLARHMVVSEGAAPVASCTVLRDISDRVEAVRQVEALKEEAVNASMIKSRFLTNMSHELRTPLNSIIGYSELLLEESPREDWEMEDIRKIRTAGSDLLRLVDEVLDFSRLESSQADIYLERVEIGALTKDLQAVIQPLVDRGDNRLGIDLTDAPAFLRTDPNKLERILLALLNNACKFTQGGQILLRVSEETINGRSHVAFEVSDTGIGIPSSQLAIIFDPFRQIDESSTRSYGGNGLGLNISQQLSKLLGGGIRVKSTPGKGSTFTLSIPDSTEMSDDNPGAKKVKSPQRSDDQPLVLVIDDIEEAADLIARHLTRLGCRVAIASDGVQGKEMAAELLPDAITLSLEMQFIDGWVVLEHLAVDRKTRDIPVIVCSNLDERKRAYGRGVAAYVMKPVSAVALEEALNRIPELNEGRRKEMSS
ncbi:MAG: response regulator [Pseudomonadales bacterium]|nr:response regulator [Pseudomonadales bacterium]